MHINKRSVQCLKDLSVECRGFQFLTSHLSLLRKIELKGCYYGKNMQETFCINKLTQLLLQNHKI